MRVMLGFFCGAISLVLASSPTNSQQSDALSSLQGLWTAKWTAQGNSRVRQVMFAFDPADSGKRTVSLPFIPGLVRISSCVGLGCSGADLVVSGVDLAQKSFDCLYAYSPHDRDSFGWTFLGGTNVGGCLPDTEFERVPIPNEGAPLSNAPPRSDNLTGVSVKYYRKFGDGSRIVDALKNANIEYIEEPAVLNDNLIANSLGCSPGTSGQAIKAIAFALMNNGIRLREIYSMGDQKNTIYITTVLDSGGTLLSNSPLTRYQIATLDSCPRGGIDNGFQN